MATLVVMFGAVGLLVEGYEWSLVIAIVLGVMVAVGAAAGRGRRPPRTGVGEVSNGSA